MITGIRAASSPALRGAALAYVTAVVVVATVAVAIASAGLGAGTDGWLTFALLGCGAAIAQLFVVFTPRNQSYHAAIAFLLAAALLLPPELVALVALVQHGPECARLRLPWKAQAFTIANHTLSALAAWGASRLVHGPGEQFGDLGWAVGAAAACAVFVGVSHLLLAGMLRFGHRAGARRGELISGDGLATDVVLAALGVGIAGFWHWNHWLVPFALLPLLLAHRSFRVPGLQEQARTDAKTGLLNARAFREALEHELARALRFRRPLAVVVLDLDHLRSINNTHGHLAGDAAIVGVADVLRRELRDYDLACRFGGEEFVVLLPETGSDEGLEIAERLRRAVAASDFPVEVTGHRVAVTISAGVAAAPLHGEDADVLLQRADDALYAAKEAGRNRAAGVAELLQG